MRIVILTNEYPPYVYGGAGVHVKYLTHYLAGLENKENTIEIFFFGSGEEQEGNILTHGINADFPFPAHDPRHEKLFNSLLKNLIMAGSLNKADIVHCHTWYTHFAGCLVKQLAGAALVLTTHSLEPQRPWKEEQLGSAYKATTWLEKSAYLNADAVIAVSESMKASVHELYGIPERRIHVIYNGIDTQEYKPTPNPEILQEYDIDLLQPYILFVGRITRQKGILHLLNAVQYLIPGVQVVLCAASPDTKNIAEQMYAAVEQAKSGSPNRILWISEMVPKDHLITFYTHAAVFVCPSVYEPFGFINIEAMACETPVVASAVGGIPEIVVDKETGFLVPFEKRSENDPEPANPGEFAADLARRVNLLLSSPAMRREMGKKARERVKKCFSWSVIAHQTLDLYYKILRQGQTK